MKTNMNVSGLRLVLIIMAIISLCVMVFLTQIDHVVNSVLYDFGLRFSYRWALPYWINSGLIVGLSWFNITASIMLIYYIFKGKKQPPGIEASRINQENKLQLKLSKYVKSSEEGAEETREQIEEQSTPLIQEQICELNLEIVEYDVRHPKEVVDSQC